jgi:hypothetical protein
LSTTAPLRLRGVAAWAGDDLAALEDDSDVSKDLETHLRRFYKEKQDYELAEEKALEQQFHRQAPKSAATWEQRPSLPSPPCLLCHRPVGMVFASFPHVRGYRRFVRACGAPTDPCPRVEFLVPPSRPVSVEIDRCTHRIHQDQHELLRIKNNHLFWNEWDSAQARRVQHRLLNETLPALTPWLVREQRVLHNTDREEQRRALRTTLETSEVPAFRKAVANDAHTLRSHARNERDRVDCMPSATQYVKSMRPLLQRIQEATYPWQWVEKQVNDAGVPQWTLVQHAVDRRCLERVGDPGWPHEPEGGRPLTSRQGHRTTLRTTRSVESRRTPRRRVHPGPSLTPIESHSAPQQTRL